MAPSIAELPREQDFASQIGQIKQSLRQKPNSTRSINQHESLTPTRVLDQFKSFECTPSLGREYPDAKLLDWMNAPNSDELLRELAITSKSASIAKNQVGEALTDLNPYSFSSWCRVFPCPGWYYR
jgi:hypothetical protein